MLLQQLRLITQHDCRNDRADYRNHCQPSLERSCHRIPQESVCVWCSRRTTADERGQEIDKDTLDQFLRR